MIAATDDRKRDFDRFAVCGGAAHAHPEQSDDILGSAAPDVSDADAERSRSQQLPRQRARQAMVNLLPWHLAATSIRLPRA